MKIGIQEGGDVSLGITAVPLVKELQQGYWGH